MRIAYRANPDDLDVCAIFVEAIMNRTPWRMWDSRTGAPAPRAGTLEAREVLEAAFRDLPGAMNHPGLLHLHVHLMEMSSNPEVALVTGDRLRDLMRQRSNQFSHYGYAVHVGEIRLQLMQSR